MAIDELRLISKNSAADRRLDLLMQFALGGVICAIEHKGRIGHNDKLQMRRSEMETHLNASYDVLYAWWRWLRRNETKR